MKTNKETFLKIAEDIQKMVEYRAFDLAEKQTKYKEAFEELCHMIESEKDHAKDLFEDCKNEGLTINSIETEGAYRAYITIFNKMNDIKEYVEKDNE